MLPLDAPAQTGLWFQSYYRIRKKVIAIANQYWIEGSDGKAVGYARQKILRIKEKIPVFSDESMSQEIFRIQQDNLADTWGTFSVIDTGTGACVGKLRREAIASGIVADSYLLMNHAGQRVGRVAERVGRGLGRKYLPGGNLVPETLVVEFGGREVTEIRQQFKIIGDIWEVDCSKVPRDFDRRTLLAAMLLMGMIERDRK